MPSLLARLEAIQPFTEDEAWNLFRLAALSEAVGWTILISGILIQRYKLPGSKIAIPIAGQVHGTLFIAYFGVLLAIYTSLQWPRKKVIFAAMAGVPPYGTLFFEQWAARKRKRAMQHQMYRRIVVHGLIVDGKSLLAVQSGKGIAWHTPGGPIAAGETPEEALSRTIFELTGIRAKIGAVCCVLRCRNRHEESLEFYFMVSNGADFRAINRPVILKKHIALDDIQFVEPQDTPDLEPAFLHEHSLKELNTQKQALFL
jgi:integral membrane protein